MRRVEETRMVDKVSGRPEYPLYAHIGGRYSLRNTKLTQKDLEILARNFEFIYGADHLSREEREYIRSINPNIKFVKYVNVMNTKRHVDVEFC